MDRQKAEGWWRHVVAQEKPKALDGIAQGVLTAASWPLEAVSRLRGAFYDAKLLATLKLPVPVVSFGNLTVGGAGKTPAVIWCAKYLKAKGAFPGIASRGYNPEAGSVEAPNDEAAVIKEEVGDVPHVWNADRVKAATELVKEHHANVVVLDDAFQYRRLHRTLDILLVDALNPFGYGYMLPRGLLREPKSALRRATHIIITRSNLVGRDELASIRQAIWAIQEGMKLSEAVHRPTGLYLAGGARQDAEALQGKKVHAFCSIATPQAFLITLAHLGAQVVGVRAFSDHHIYAEGEIDGVFDEAVSRGADLVVTTQKDRVKCGWREGSKVPLGELRVEFELVKGKETVESALDFLAASVTEATRA